MRITKKKTNRGTTGVVRAILKEAAKQREEAVRERENADRQREEAAREREEAARQREEAAREREKPAGQQENLSKAHADMEKALGRLSNRLGDIAEAQLTPNLVEKFRALGFGFERMSRNAKWYNPDTRTIYVEIDALLENGDTAMDVEVKTNLTHDDVNEHLIQLKKIRTYAAGKGDLRVFCGGLAGMVVSESVKTYALSKGLYVIEPSGEDVKITAPKHPNSA